MYPSTGMKSGIKSIGLNAYATVKMHMAFARNGVSLWVRANQSMTASRLIRFAQIRIESTIPISKTFLRLLQTPMSIVEHETVTLCQYARKG